jgi:GT2 family glycosyltransferase
METRAPAVVAVIVTTAPAPGLEATLSTLIGQDYDELSVLVVVNGEAGDVPARVAAVAPAALVKVLEANRGFAAACNEAAVSVTGATFFLFAHDDVLFYEGSVRALVEAAFRSNAGIVTPKFVAYEDPYVLLHVGQMADRFGAVRERIEAGEVDHGQHDLERDVFVAPGGATLVRHDLFETIHGFDPMIPALGEDLDLCWRAQIAGARIIVAPSAVVAHRETLATGERDVAAVGTRNASRRALRRRHQLATVLTCTGWLSMFIVIPALVILDVAETLLALFGRDRERLTAILGSWRWVLRHRRHLHDRRRELAHVRVLSDSQVNRLQIGGASRLKTFFTTLFQDGLDRARGILPDEDEIGEIADDEVLSVGFGGVFSEDESFDDYGALEDPEVEHRVGRLFAGARSQLVAVGALVLLWFFAVRNLIGSTLPNVGRLAPLDSWWTTWRHFFASWSPNGVGTGTPPMPGYGVLAFFGTFVVGRMGILPKLALVAMVPIGAIGVWRLLTGVVSNRARLFGVAAYVAFPLGANLIESGRIDLLAIIGLLPYAVRRILLLLNVEGFRPTPLATGVGFGHRGWGATRAGQTALLVVYVALMTALAPVSLVVVLLIIAALALAGRLTRSGDEGRFDRPGVLALDVFLGTGLLLAPLALDTIFAGRDAFSVFGQPVGGWSAPSLGELLRGATGTFGFGWAAWALPVAALFGLLIARGARRRLAMLFATITVSALVIGVVVGQHWLGSFTPDLGGIDAAVALGIAVLAAVAVAALETDLSSWTFGWHQGVAALALAAIAVSVVPLFTESSSGRFNLPATGTPELLGSMAPSAVGGYRVLWLGDPRVLPIAGWSVAPGLAAATTTDSVPDGSTLFSPPNQGASSTLVNALRLALEGKTAHLGQLLAPSGVSSIVVMNSIAPELIDVQHYPIVRPPSGLVPALTRQSDLALASHTASVIVFDNAVFHGIIAQRAQPLSPSTTSSNPSSVVGWRPAIDYGTKVGVVSHGTVLAGLAPASAFALSVNGIDAPRSSAFGWAATYAVTDGQAKLVLHQLPLNGVLAALTLAVWVAIALGFGGLEALDRRGRRTRRSKVVVEPLDDFTSDELAEIGAEGDRP